MRKMSLRAFGEAVSSLKQEDCFGKNALAMTYLVIVDSAFSKR